MKINIILKAGGEPPAKFYLNKVSLMLMLLLFISSFSALKADELSDLTSELIKIRSEVEALQNELDIEKNALKNLPNLPDLRIISPEIVRSVDSFRHG